MSPRLEGSGYSQAHYSLKFLGSSDSSASVFAVAGTLQVRTSMLGLEQNVFKSLPLIVCQTICKKEIVVSLSLISQKTIHLCYVYDFLQVVLLSPVPELRDSSKLHDSLYNEDCTFQQLGTYIHSIRDPVHNRVTLVSINIWQLSKRWAGISNLTEQKILSEK